MKALIIAAMQEEIDQLIAHLDELKEEWLHGFHLHRGKLGEHEVIIALSGIGKVNAVVITTLLVSIFCPDYVINCGSAAALNETIQIGDVVIANKLVYFDVNVTKFGYQYGQIPKMPHYYASDTALTEKITQLIYTGKFNIHYGTACSGDSFVDDITQVNHIKSQFENVLTLDMESAAIAQACHRMNQPFVAIRAITDYACNEATSCHEVNLKLACANFSNLIIDLHR